MFRACIITISDSSYYENKDDITGKKLKKFLEENGYEVKILEIVADEINMIKEKLISICDSGNVDIIFTNGGTGLSPRDVTPEATALAIEREVPGICEYMRNFCVKYTKNSILSRAKCGIRKSTIILNLPGSPKASIENLSSVIDVLEHGLNTLLRKETDCANMHDKR